MKDPGKVFSETVTEIPEMPKAVTTAVCGSACSLT